MSASERLIAARRAVEEFTQLAENGDDLLDELLDAYAEQLAIREIQRVALHCAAEEIRQRGGSSLAASDYLRGMGAAADLIDPEVEDD